MTTFPTGQGDAGATNAAPGHTDPGTADREHTDDLSPETVAALVTLARVIDPEVCDGPDRALPVGEAAEVWRRQDAALLTARRLWEAGYRPQPASGPRAPGDLAAEQGMARVMDPNAHDESVPMWPERRTERMDSALAHAIAAIEAGFRLVSEDDATVERVAAAVWHSDVLRFADLPASDWGHVEGRERKDYLRIAAAAVRALREEQ